jgi:hypothetical protein
VNFNGKRKVSVLALTVLLPLSQSAWAAEPAGPVNDGSTVSTQVKTGLDQYRGATSLSDTELADLLKLVGFSGKSLRTAWAIVMRESRGHPLSHNGNASTGDDSYGLFQINMRGSLGSERREKFGISKDAELLDPVTNAQAAYYMSSHGENFGSWGVGPNAYDGSASEPAVTIWLSKFPG